jgi:Na+-driven multidrug efflux pump
MATDLQTHLRQDDEAPIPDAYPSLEIPDRPPDPPRQTNEEEHYRLGGRPPLKTLAILSVGPLVSQIVSAVYGIVTSMWMARAMGDLGMAAISLFSNLDNCGRAFGFFMNCAASSKISALLGVDAGSEAGQLMCDLLRCCLLCGMICPAIFIPTCTPLARWFGATDLVIHYGREYLSVLLGASSITCVYLLTCGALQAEGRSILVGAIQITSLLANMAIFNPLFLLVFKWETLGAAFATVLSELIPSIIFVVLYFRGKFGVKPELGGLFRKFSSHTLPAIRVGVSQLVMNLARSIPSILLRKFMGLCTEHSSDVTFDDAMMGFNGFIRIAAVIDGFRLAISMGMLPGLSYANAAGRVERGFRLIAHASWINAVFGTIVALVTAFWARYLAMAISSSETYLKWATAMLLAGNWEVAFGWIRNVVQTTLQALQYGTTATFYSFGATFLAYMAVVSILYVTDKTNVVRLIYTMPIYGAFAALVGIVLLIYPLRKLWVNREQVSAEVEATHESEPLALEEVETEKEAEQAP